MKIHREILGRLQRKALTEVGPAAAAAGFYLGGGTALALRLGHRLSVDLDWFSDARLGDPARLAAELRQAGAPLVTTMMAEGTLYGTVERVPTSFLQYPYARLRPLGRARGFRIASLDDLACMKLSAVVDRGSRKDFVDIFALCREHRPLPELLALYARRFATADPGHVMVALSYFADAEQAPMPRMIWDVDWDTVKRSITGWIRETAGRL
jgi:Nucleotidyl transferase AbiEii toxin, Type IV TA system